MLNSKFFLEITLLLLNKIYLKTVKIDWVLSALRDEGILNVDYKPPCLKQERFWNNGTQSKK